MSEAVLLRVASDRTDHRGNKAEAGQGRGQPASRSSSRVPEGSGSHKSTPQKPASEPETIVNSREHSEQDRAGQRRRSHENLGQGWAAIQTLNPQVESAWATRQTKPLVEGLSAQGAATLIVAQTVSRPVPNTTTRRRTAERLLGGSALIGVRDLRLGQKTSSSQFRQGMRSNFPVVCRACRAWWAAGASVRG
jgi:hypothetical protein